ncbi:shikimate kinase [Vagococcus zengguangii]|uniref:Shikimate kinase n=1 Tax=Vagococcus zengguangii TaxID=2571750 RepID=A0A4D7CSP7_9ENTE|nr:shikimate kinase [Vagococcus zengguangii]QCI86133.1 shikimate kinase [Vagococcus zengguangii]
MNDGIVLVGFMGSGKSSVAQALSQQTSLPVVDLDRLIETTTGQTIPTIFSTQGEREFRHIETTCLRQVINMPAIISTGGGIVLSEENRHILKASFKTVVWLQADFDTYYKRITEDKQNSRPIANQSSKNDLAKIEQERRVLYEAVADVVIDVSKLTVNQIASQMLESIVK